MVSRRKLLPRPLLSVLSLAAGLTGAVASQADDKPPQKTAPKPAQAAPSQPKPKRPAPKKAPAGPVVTEEMKFKETQVLRKAYVLLAEANHDYDGHRAKALRAVKDAGLILDESILKHGSAKLKAATLKEKAVVAGIEEAAKQTPVLNEPQPASDRQLRGAAELLLELRPTLAKNKQQKVLGHLDTAIKEIRMALKVR